MDNAICPNCSEDYDINNTGIANLIIVCDFCGKPFSVMKEFKGGSDAKILPKKWYHKLLFLSNPIQSAIDPEITITTKLRD